QAEREQRAADHHTDVLFSINGIRHRAGGYRRSEIRLPEQFAVSCVECVEGAIPAAAEQDVGGGGQNARFRGWRGLAVIPLLLARLRIDRPDGAVDIVASRARSREESREALAFVE